MDIVAGPVDYKPRSHVFDRNPHVYIPTPFIPDEQEAATEATPSRGPLPTAAEAPRRGQRRAGNQLQSQQSPEGKAHAIASTGWAFRFLVTQVPGRAELPSAPPEAAGPLTGAERNAADIDHLTMSNAVGNVRIFYRVINDEPEVRCWVLRRLENGEPAWVSAEAGALHPEQAGLRGYRLSLRKPLSPSWVTGGTWINYKAPSKQKNTRWW